MDCRTASLGDSLEEPHEYSSPSCSRGSAIQFAKGRPPLRIVVPPTEYCPFSTNLTLPITPVSSSCFTFSDFPELATQNVSVPPIPSILPSSCPQITAVTGFASPTSSQFLLIPPTPHLENMDSGTASCVSPLAMPGAANGSVSGRSQGAKCGNLRPWEVSTSTWLSDLGGHTETDRIFRQNLLEMDSVDTESSHASTPALSPSVTSPFSQVSSVLVYNSPTSPASSLASSPSALLSCQCTMSPQSSSPMCLVLKPTGTDTFPSMLDSLQTWREGVASGLPRSEETSSPLSEAVYGSPLGGLEPETPTHPSSPSQQLQAQLFPPRVSRSQTFIKHAKMFGGRVKRLVTRQSVHKHRSSMDQGVNLRVITDQDSEHGSVILITAPPPPYDVRQLTLISHSPTGQELARSRTNSEYSSAIQAGTVELATTGITDMGPRQRGSRNAFRRLSLAALSTIKRL